MEVQVENTHPHPQGGRHMSRRAQRLRAHVCQFCDCSSLRGDQEEAVSCPPEAHSRVRRRDFTEAGGRGECSHRLAGEQSGSLGRDCSQFRKV